MDTNNGGENDQGRAPTGNRNETWKDQIRQAIEESRRNIERQQVEQQAPGYRITLNTPEVTKSYYKLVRSDTKLRTKSKELSRYGATSEGNISKSQAYLKRSRNVDRFPQNYDRDRLRTAADRSNVTPTSTRTNAWSKYASTTSHKLPKKGKRSGDKSQSLVTASENEDLSQNQDLTTLGESETEALLTGETGGDTGEVLSYFDPQFVKEEFKEILAKSRNIVIGPPKEILKKYFGLVDDEQIPLELQHDNSPKAFILPRTLWKDYDDVHSTTTAQTSQILPNATKTPKQEDLSPAGLDRRLLKRMEEEKEVEPFISRQPKNFAVDYLSRQSFKKYGMVSSNLNDASPGMMEHLEMKNVNADPGGHLRRDPADKQFKISEVTDTPVKVAAKEGDLPAYKRPWYVEEWTDGVNPKLLTKSPNFITGKDDVVYPDQGDGEPPKSPNRSDSSESSSGSGYSCTCGDSSTSSGSSDGSGSSGSSASNKSSSADTTETWTGKRKRRHRHSHSKKKGTAKDDDPSTRDIAVDANMANEEIPSWAPESWKSPSGYKGWIYKPKLLSSQSAPETSVNFDDSSRLPGSDWFRAFGVVRKAEKEGTIDSLRHILGYVDGEDDLMKLEEEEPQDAEEEEGDPMERLPRSDLPSRRLYPEFPKPEHIQYYRSYPLYPTLSSERYFEWYKDVHRLTDPFGRRKSNRPAGLSKSMGSINWDDPKEAAKWYSYGYRRPDTRPKPERTDFNTKDYIYDNARSTMLMPARKIIPKYVDDRNGTTHLLESSGLVKKFIFRDDFGKVPDYLTGRNEELGRPPYPDMDKFYRPHRCKYLHGHIHCKICMRAHPAAGIRKPPLTCDMIPTDYEKALEYRNSKRLLNPNSSTQYSYTPSSLSRMTSKGHTKTDVESLLNDIGLGEEYRRSKAARKNQNLSSVRSNFSSKTFDVVLPPVYV